MDSKAAAAGSLSPTSPVSIRSHGGANGGPKRKRSSGAVMSPIDSSPGSDHDDDLDGHPEKKRQPGVKRACNECRQQKVSHRIAFARGRRNPQNARGG